MSPRVCRLLFWVSVFVVLILTFALLQGGLAGKILMYPDGVKS